MHAIHSHSHLLALDPGAGSEGPGAGAEGADGEAAAMEVGGADPYAGMSERQRKLAELRQKMAQCRKANQNAVIAEKKRQKVRARAAFHGVHNALRSMLRKRCAFWCW